MKELIHFGRSWAYPAELSLTGSGFTSQGYDKSQRCYQLESNEPKGGQVEISLKGSKDSPVVNPAIRIKNWNSDEAKVLVNGKESGDCRLGFNHQIEGTDLVVFALMNETSPVQMTIRK
jgi:hypothetical protein